MKWSLSPDDFSTYYAYFFQITPHGCLLSGARVRDFFLQTKLPLQTLSQIWRLSDLDGDGCLNPAEFAVAMHLTRVCLEETSTPLPLPLSCPGPLVSVVKQTLNPQLPVATQAHLTKCRNAFGAFYENIGKGVLGGDAARYLMMKSNLSEAQLFHIWKLSDIDQDGRLTFMEFTLAMQLIFIAKLGYTLPVDLDPNTILPPSFFKIIGDVQNEVEQFPEVTPNPNIFDPLSPSSASDPSAIPIFLEENPFISNGLKLSTKHFRERDYDHFTGDPFVEIAEGNRCSMEVSEFVESSPSNYLTTIREDSLSTTPDSSVSAPDSPPLVNYQKTNGHMSSLPPTPEPLFRSHSPRQPSPVDLKTQSSPTPNLGNGLSQPSYKHTSSNGSIREREDQSASPSPLASSHESPNPPSPQGRLSTGGGGSQTDLYGQELHPDLSQQSNSSYRQSRESLSSPYPKNNRQSGTSSNASFQDVVIVERTEPVLQVARAVDVIGSRETTPVPDHEVDTSAPQCPSPSDVTKQLETLSKASRKLVAKSETKLKKQQETANIALATEEYRQVSVKGLSATIREIEDTDDQNLENESQEPITPVSDPTISFGLIPGEGVDFEDDLSAAEVLSQFDDLEAEIMSVLDDADFDVDDFDSEEDVPVDYDGVQVEIGALYMDNPASGVMSDVRTSGSRETTPTGLVDDIRATPTELVKIEDLNNVKTRRSGKNTPTGFESVDASEEGGMSKLEIRPSHAKFEPKKRTSEFLEATMEDLDSFLNDELADINDMFQEFQTKDKKFEQRLKTEEEELKHIHLKASSEELNLPHGDTAESMKKITQKRNRESEKIAQEWEQEMLDLEVERSKALEEQKHKQEQSDVILQNLDDELSSLIKHEEEAVKIARKEKELFQQRERERKEREEKEKQERLKRGNQEEMTIEEWIEWMEEKKKHGMTPEQLEEHERRRTAWLAKEKHREEKRKREEDEKLAKTRMKMENELRAIHERDIEMRSSRLTEEQLEEERCEKALRDEKISRQRKERSKLVKEEIKQREIEELKPKARSALAARWEERVRAKGDGKVSREEHGSTVLTGTKRFSIGEKESRRLSNRIRPLSMNSVESESSSGTKRYSIA